MTRITLLAGVLLSMTTALSAQSKVFEKTVHLNSGGSLRLHASRGSVRLTSWDMDQVEVRARIEAEGSWNPDSARRAVEATTVEVTTFGNEVTIRSNDDSIANLARLFDGRSPNIHYDIRAPRRIDLRLNIDRSNSTIRGFQGRVDLDVDRSEISAADLAGPMSIRLDRSDNSSFRNIRGSFNIVADRSNIRLDVLKLDGSSQIQIDRGNVDVSLDRGQGVNLETSGSKRTSFDTTLPVRWDRRRSNPSGPINGGGPRLSINADRSDIRLR